MGAETILVDLLKKLLVCVHHGGRIGPLANFSHSRGATTERGKRTEMSNIVGRKEREGETNKNQ
jgi:hypothetical protein